ncbi:hypothetical protein [Salinithrix halophila]|uniref:CcmD family protein n=1 Tax=Salinithrix halophila TaxID=1485204 RepID=A0ABV8JAH1_9BACL
MPGSLILFGVIIYLLFMTFMIIVLGRAVLTEHRDQVAREETVRWQIRTTKKKSLTSRRRTARQPVS